MSSFDTCATQQGFGSNFNNAYRPLLGHPGIDTLCGYGTDIVSPVNGIVFSTYTPYKPASDGYTAIYIFCQNKLETYEYNIGHCSEIYVKPGDVVKKGQVIGKEGNHGLVYVGDTKITLEMQKSGDHRGSHRHNQKRPLEAVKWPPKAIPVIRNDKGIWQSPGGQIWGYAMPQNGYNGCTDFTKPLFGRDLFFGVRGYDVKLLQRALDLPEDLQTGFFGMKTLAAVSSFQNQNGLSPIAGYCGVKTRGILNAMFNPLDSNPL